MFAILIPASLSPLVVTLYWAERKAKRLGLAPTAGVFSGDTWKQRIWNFIEQLDLVGLIILGASVALILLPLTLSQTAKSGWDNGW
jgi:hypothetical protein